MALTETQREIKQAIHTLCAHAAPFTTANEIAEYTGISKKTILTHVDTVLSESNEIENRTVGQANVYYVKADRFDEIVNLETEDIIRLHDTSGRAEYVEIRKTTQKSDFDFITHWYDADATEIEEYVPNSNEIGKAAEVYATDATSIKYYDETDYDTEFELVEETDTYEKYDVVESEDDS